MSKWPVLKYCGHPWYYIRYSPPLTNLVAQTEFSQPQNDCSGSSKDGHGLKFEWWIVELM